ncbi:MAG: hypothetical protein KJ944_20455 [Alphaproteobacteria bacterium]|nr:hypothetical protein [Alphaproteobacteria bacterium]MBU1560990.1 hypothetical protein [Alphaproteobacteria bacterium]MBU2304964.1 hypothetical protein [Alphaproteobacteria bacterium]MBU2370216.1 hypothetical protein [Alphaproteobacteria bacterium]
MAAWLGWFMDGTNLGSLVAAASAAGALWQYRRNSLRHKDDLAQRQAVTAVQETLALLNDPEAQRALSALDYSEPTTMRALRLHAATYETDPASAFSEDEKKARDNMDQLLTRLEMIDFLIERNVIAKADFRKQFAYWLELLGEIPDRHDTLVHFSDTNRRTLWAYIRTYRFLGVISLFARYDRASKASGTTEALFVAR